MDKRDEEMIKETRLQLQKVSECLHMIDEYLHELLHKRAVADINEAMRTGNEIPEDELQDIVTRGYQTRDITTDPRYPYQNQRQPRRDGDSYGTVPAPSSEGTSAERKRAFELSEKAREARYRDDNSAGSV